MVNQVITGLIAGVVGAVAYIAVNALVGSSIYGPAGNATWAECKAKNATMCPDGATAGETMIHDILPLAIAIMVVAGLFMGLTRVRGV